MIEFTRRTPPAMVATTALPAIPMRSNLSRRSYQKGKEWIVEHF
jgi:hypothetical protein